MKAFLEKIQKEVKTYEDLIVPLGSYYVCKEILEELHKNKERNNATLAEFMLNFKKLWGEK